MTILLCIISDMKSRYDALAQSASEKVAKIEEVLESRKQLETDQGKVNKWSEETGKQIDHDVDLGMGYFLLWLYFYYLSECRFPKLVIFERGPILSSFNSHLTLIDEVF